MLAGLKERVADFGDLQRHRAPQRPDRIGGPVGRPMRRQSRNHRRDRLREGIPISLGIIVFDKWVANIAEIHVPQ